MVIDGVGIPIVNEVGIWVGSIVAGFFALNRVWRAFGRTRVEDKKDRAEINILELLQKENDMLRLRADMFADERNEAQRELGALRAQVESLKETLAECRRQLDALTNQLDVLRRKHGD